MKVSILGASRSGKTWLASALVDHFQALGRTSAIIPDRRQDAAGRANRALRTNDLWCLTQAHIRYMDEAPLVDMLIADTTPLITAIDSDLQWGDPSIYELALAQQRNFDLTLLTGLDLPQSHDGEMLAAPQQQQTDASLRAALQQAGIAYGVVYGNGPQRLQNALRLLVPQETPPARWTGLCEKCSDPDCEFRLFTALQNSKAAVHLEA